MKADIAYGFISLVLHGLAWILIVTVAATASARLRSRSTRVAVVLGAVASVPLYVFMMGWLESHRAKRNFEQRRSIAEESAERFRALCAEPPQLRVPVPLRISSAVELQIRQSPYFPLDVMEPAWPEKIVCPTSATTLDCPKPTVRTVQWEFKSVGSWCERASTPIPNDCHRIWHYSTITRLKTDAKSLNARFVLEISRPDRITPLIELFTISLIDTDSSTTLGQTVLYKKALDLADLRMGEGPRFCPDRDRAIGALLSNALLLD
jgi:hypothetical protein